MKKKAHQTSGFKWFMLVTKNNQFIVGDKNTKKLVQLAERVAKTDVTVFINGPTGTGKSFPSSSIATLRKQ